MGDAYGGPVDGLSILGYKLSLNKNDVALLETQCTVKPKEFFLLQPNLVLFRLVQLVLGVGCNEWNLEQARRCFSIRFELFYWNFVQQNSA